MCVSLVYLLCLHELSLGQDTMFNIAVKGSINLNFTLLEQTLQGIKGGDRSQSRQADTL